VVVATECTMRRGQADGSNQELMRMGYVVWEGAITGELLFVDGSPLTELLELPPNWPLEQN
jgi:hypothetical protein